jgi:hypothetical protein
LIPAADHYRLRLFYSVYLSDPNRSAADPYSAAFLFVLASRHVGAERGPIMIFIKLTIFTGIFCQPIQRID